MPIFRQGTDGRFVPFQKTPFPDLEKQLEDWIETNPHLLLEGERLAIIGRQTGTAFGRALDLLAIDESGATVVIELKRGTSPRDVLAQTLEYTAWVDSLSNEDLDGIARAYAAKKGLAAEDLAELYAQALGGQQESQEEEEADESRVTFNARQRMVIVAEDFPGEMEQTLRYLRARLGLDISAIRFGVHIHDNETLLQTETVVGREPIGTVKTPPGAAGVPFTHDEIRERVTTDFLRDQVDGLEQWIQGLGVPNLYVQHFKGTHHSIYLGGQRLGGYYFAKAWAHFWLIGRVDDDEADMMSLSSPAKIELKDNQVSGNVANEQDLAVFRRQLIARSTAA